MIERLRALEKEMRWAAMTPKGVAGCSVNSFADKLATLIAELGQEVGAVDFPPELKDRVDRLQAKASQNASSPAHTSEARDAEVAELIEATRRLTADIEFRIDDPRSQLLDRARRATTAAVGCNCPGSARVSYLSHAPNCPAREALGKFAAMRQEAGE